MLDEGKPDKIIAFTGGPGTANMIKQSKKADKMPIEVPARPKCYILVGLPGSGKSHWREEFYNSYDTGASSGEYPYCLSTDDIIENICDEYGLTYNQGWPKLIDFANMMYNNYIDDYFKQNLTCDIIFDRTNLTKKSRKAIIDRFKKDYEIVVKTFEVDDETRISRCNQRIGKSIPEDAIERMMRDYQPFTEDELS